MDDILTTDEPTKKTFLVKGGGLRADKVAKPSPNEFNDDQNIDDKFTPDKSLIEQSNREKSPLTPSRDKDSGKRRTRQARRPNADHSSELRDNYILEKKSSLEEFEEIEKNISKTPEKKEYDNNSKYNESTAEKRRKPKNDKSQADSKDDNKNFNKSINEGGGDRQRLAKEKQEFKKLKEKFESEKLTFEKQKRDFDKQKLEFDKLKDVEMKKINAEKQKFEKERKAFSRQNDKSKDEKQLVDKLYKEIETLKEEVLHKDDRVSLNFHKSLKINN